MLTSDDLTAVQLMIDSAVIASQQQHQHLGFDSQILSGANLQNAPQPALVPVTGSLSTGGSTSLKATDATILTANITLTNAIASALKKLGFTY